MFLSREPFALFLAGDRGGRLEPRERAAHAVAHGGQRVRDVPDVDLAGLGPRGHNVRVLPHRPHPVHSSLVPQRPLLNDRILVQIFVRGLGVRVEVQAGGARAGILKEGRLGKKKKIRKNLGEKKKKRKEKRKKKEKKKRKRKGKRKGKRKEKKER